MGTATVRKSKGRGMGNQGNGKHGFTAHRIGHSSCASKPGSRANHPVRQRLYNNRISSFGFTHFNSAVVNSFNPLPSFSADCHHGTDRAMRLAERHAFRRDNRRDRLPAMPGNFAAPCGSCFVHPRVPAPPHQSARTRAQCRRCPTTVPCFPANRGYGQTLQQHQTNTN